MPRGAHRVKGGPARRMRAAVCATVLWATGCAGARAMRGTTDDDDGARTIPGNEGTDPGWSTVSASTQSMPGNRRTVLLTEALREFAQRDPATSSYSHTTLVDEVSGTRQIDCSGYVDYVLRRVLPDAYELVPRSGARRPRAQDYYVLLAHAPDGETTDTTRPRWRRIETVQALQPGDLVAWLRSPDSTSTNTGHVMVVHAQPTRGRAGEWLVAVLDSVAGGHASDPRRHGLNGIGEGVIGLVADIDGRPTAFYWRGGESARAHATEIALGRLE